jgi:hypothetical protein
MKIVIVGFPSGRDVGRGKAKDADHGASPTTAEVDDKEHYRPKLYELPGRFFIHLQSSTATRRGFPNK